MDDADFTAEDCRTYETVQVSSFSRSSENREDSESSNDFGDEAWSEDHGKF